MKYDQDTYDSLREQVKINKDILDEETIAQPNLFFHASEGFSYAVSRRDRREHELEVCMAELDREIRDTYAADGQKITEASIKQQILREPAYQTAHKAWLDACFVANRWESLKNAFRQRADMLRSLIQLHQTGYFGEVTGAAERTMARARYSERRHDG